MATGYRPVGPADARPRARRAAGIRAGPTCTVAANGGTYTTIQAAVNDSGCSTITVAAGTYTENVTIRRNVTINGATTGTTIVDGNNAGTVFNIQTGTVTLAYLTIQHGNNFVGGGIENWGTLTVTNSTISDNSATAGGGISNHRTLTVTNSTIRGNYAGNEGGGIENWGTLTVINSTFSGNTTDGAGGGIASVGRVSVTNSTFSGNSAHSVGGVSIGNAISLTLINSIFSDNHTYSRNANCMDVGYLKSQGVPHQEIARLCRISRQTRVPILHLYQDGGIERLTHFHVAGQPRALTDHQSTLEAHFRRHPPRRVAQAHAELARLTGIRRGPTPIRTFLKRIGMQVRTVAAIPGRAHDPMQQQEPDALRVANVCNGAYLRCGTWDRDAVAAIFLAASQSD